MALMTTRACVCDAYVCLHVSVWAVARAVLLTVVCSHPDGTTCEEFVDAMAELVGMVAETATELFHDIVRYRVSCGGKESSPPLVSAEDAAEYLMAAVPSATLATSLDLGLLPDSR